MKQAFLKLLLFLFCASPVFTASTAWSQEKGDVVVELTARKVIKQEGGKERLEPADKAKPGDVIEYTAVYRNTGKKSVKDLMATLPVPEGTEYLSRTADPANAHASLDGKKFAPVPLKRKVKVSDGKEVSRDVPAAEYRSLRWEIKQLGAGETVSVKARVRIISAIEIKQ